MDPPNASTIRIQRKLQLLLHLAVPISDFSPLPPPPPPMASSKLRSSSLLLGLLLSSLNLLLLLLAAASFVPIVLLRRPPTALGWGLLAVSAATLLSSFLGFYAHLSHCCFTGHISLVVASSVGQAMGFLALFLREERSLGLLGSRRSPRETRFLFRVEEGALAGMFLAQSLVLMLSCALQSCWAREYEEVEAEREAAARKRSRRMARVQEESLANATAMAEVKEKELEEKMKSKYGRWARVDVEPPYPACP